MFVVSALTISSFFWIPAQDYHIAEKRQEFNPLGYFNQEVSEVPVAAGRKVPAPGRRAEVFL